MSGLFGDFGGLFGAIGSMAMSNEQSQYMNNAAMANAQMYRNQMMQNIQAAQNPLAFAQAKKQPTVAQTAASRVDKPDWEKRADAKDKELNEWLYSIGLGHIAEMDFSSAHDDDVL